MFSLTSRCACVADIPQEAAGTSIPRIARTRTPRADEEDEVPELVRVLPQTSHPTAADTST